MRRLSGMALLVSVAVLLVAVAPVAAGTRTAVTMSVSTTFDPDADAFTATGIPGCSAGWVSDGGAHLEFKRPLGVFAGYKVFDCGSGTGFVLRLNARFGPDGSVGTWSVVDAWGAAAGMSGAGSLTGSPIGGGILDSYSGTLTF